MSTSKTMRRICARGARLGLACAALGFCVGCDDEAALKMFRDTAATNIQQGINSILDGIVDGVFAVVQMGDDAATQEEQTTDTSGGD
jgi:hypothetical protein